MASSPLPLHLAPPPSPRTHTTGRKHKSSTKRPRPDTELEAKAETIDEDGGLPPAPDHLDEHESRLWDYFGELVVGMRVLSKNDLTALGILCEAEAARLELGDYLKENGRFHQVVTTAGDTVDRARPQFTEWQRLNKEVMGQLREFGLTPASRPKIQIVPGAGTGMGGGGGEVEDEEEKAEKAYW